MAGGAPFRDLGDEARRVFVRDIPVVFGRIELGGGVGDPHARARRAGFLRDRPEDPVVAVPVRIVAGAAAQRDGLAVVDFGADWAVAPGRLGRCVHRVGRSDRGVGGEHRDDAAGVRAPAPLAGGVGGVDQRVLEAAAAQSAGRAAPFALRNSRSRPPRRCRRRPPRRRGRCSRALFRAPSADRGPGRCGPDGRSRRCPW